jgi:GTP-binding protein
MHIVSADFVTSAVSPAQYPAPPLPEIAFAGRSNVGKSSLINTLVNRRRLVKTSSTPGRTQLINFFRINGAFDFVDLPGYGYARVPRSVQRRWGPMVETYLSARKSLKGVVVIMDIRREPGVEEGDLLGWLKVRRIPALRVLTKADKLSRAQQKRRTTAAATLLDMPPEQLIVFSAKSRQGRAALWKALLALIEKDDDDALQGHI